MPIAYLDLKYDRRNTITSLYNDPFTITAEVDDCTIIITNISDNTDHVFKISYDDGMTWTNLSVPHSDSVSITIDNQYSSIMLVKTDASKWMDNIRITSETDSEFSVSGNIMTLMDATQNITSVPVAYFNGLFSDAHDLIDASGLEFPATTVGDSGYTNMFARCYKLKKAPSILPATTISNNCYKYMFGDCHALTDPPILPATTLALDCYAMMFWGCNGMTTPPALPATTLAQGCYFSMFGGCSSLTTAPVLNATTLAYGCYHSMFTNCSSLVTPPALPATTLAERCYYDMFDGCSSITTAPNLLASNMTEECYRSMFYNCTSLNFIRILATDTATDFITDWVHNVAPTGTFVKDQYATYQIDSDSGVPIGWTVVNEGQNIPVYYTMTINVDPTGSGTTTGSGTYSRGDTITINANANGGYNFAGWYDSNNVLVSTSNLYLFTITQNTTFTAKFVAATFCTVTLSMDDPELQATLTGAGTYELGSIVTISASNISGYNFVGWKSNNTIVSNQQTWTFTLNTNMSLSAVYEEIIHDYSHEYLTIEILDNSSYVFIEAYNLNVLSTIDIKVNSSQWYTYDFSHMIHMYDEPYGDIYTLPGEILPDKGEAGIPLSLDIGDKVQLRRLVKNGINNYANYGNIRIGIGHAHYQKRCKVYGNIACLEPYHDDINNMTDTYYAGINLTHMYENGRNTEIYAYLFSPLTMPTSNGSESYRGCSVTDASHLILPFTTLTVWAYENMFFQGSDADNSSYLTSAPELPATTLASMCYYRMFYGCTSLTTITNILPATTLAYSCYGGMFYGCNHLTAAPILPATTLVENCYINMFKLCDRLINITCLATDISANYCTYNWVEGVGYDGTFTKAANMANWTTGVSGIPSGWTVQNAS